MYMAKSHASASALREVLRVFALFGHPLRVVIFQRLARAPMTAGELARGLPISRTAIVQHLKLLEGARLVQASFDGRRRIYRVRASGLAPLENWLAQYLRDLSPTNIRRPSATLGQARPMTTQRKKPKKPESFAAGVGRGMRRAAKTARKVARMHGTPVYFWRNGRVVAEKP
jgi:DNA-binding transcriptional ArsR family regulator